MSIQFKMNEEEKKEVIIFMLEQLIDNIKKCKYINDFSWDKHSDIITVHSGFDITYQEGDNEL